MDKKISGVEQRDYNGDDNNYNDDEGEDEDTDEIACGTEDSDRKFFFKHGKAINQFKATS
eukprot:10955563-Ditylum_brightwellii.AAC.1